MPDPKTVERARQFVAQKGHQPRFVVTAMGKSEHRGGLKFLDHETILVVTESGAVLLKPVNKGLLGGRLELLELESFDFGDMTDMGVAGPDGAPKIIRFVLGLDVVVHLIDVGHDPSWDAMVAFWSHRVDASSALSQAAAEIEMTQNWRRVRDHVLQGYPVSDDTGDMLTLILDVPGGDRTQLALVRQRTLKDGEEEWLDISAPIGRTAGIDLRGLLARVSGMVVGGLVVVGEVAILRQVVRMDDVNLEVLDRIIRLVAMSADMLESEFVRSDGF